MDFDNVPFTELLSNIVDNRGRTCPTAETGFPLIATNCVRNDLLYPAFEKVRYVSTDTYKTWFRGHPLPGDLIFVCKGTPGRVCIAPDPVSFCIAQDMVAVRADPKKIYPKYLFALLRSSQVQAQIGNMHVGTLIPHFKKGDFDKLLLPVPEKKTQETIGDTYFELSAQIELNRRMNATLEAMARALFQSWFVDFDPVRAKLDGRQPTGLDKATAALFPDHLDDSPLGHIPKGWNVGSILRQADLLSGGTPKTDVAAYWNGDIRWASAKDVSQCGEAFLVSTKRTITRQGVEESSTKIIPEFATVVVARGATTGRLTMFGHAMAMNQTCYGLRSKFGAPFSLYCHARHFIERLVQGGHGSIFDTITTSTFEATDVILPPEKVLLAFDKHVTPLFQQVRANLYQSRTLAALRETLLPKLLSGELSVEEVSQA